MVKEKWIANPRCDFTRRFVSCRRCHLLRNWRGIISPFGHLQKAYNQLINCSPKLSLITLLLASMVRRRRRGRRRRRSSISHPEDELVEGAFVRAIRHTLLFASPKANSPSQTNRPGSFRPKSVTPIIPGITRKQKTQTKKAINSGKKTRETGPASCSIYSL